MRRSGRLLTATLALVVLASACNGDEESSADTTGAPQPAARSTPLTTAPSSTAPSTTTSTDPASTVAVVDDGSLVGVPAVDAEACDVGAPRDAATPEITFVVGGFLLGVTPDGTGLRCFAPFENQRRIAWGPRGDTLLAGTTRIGSDESFAGGVGEGAIFTRPLGRGFVWVDGGRLWMSAFDGAELRDISFLPSHRAVAHHPAGMQVATAGVDDDGKHGVWIASNDGTEPRRVVRADHATIGEVAFSQNSGSLLSFVATHPDGVTHVHELSLTDAVGVAPHNEVDTSIALETTRQLSGLRADPWSDRIAVTEGTCDDLEGPRARLAWSDVPLLGADTRSEVIAWITGSRVVVAAYPEGCDGRRDLWIVGTDPMSSSAAPVLLVRDAGPAVAVRAILPEPPLPLGDVGLHSSGG